MRFVILALAIVLGLAAGARASHGGPFSPGSDFVGPPLALKVKVARKSDVKPPPPPAPHRDGCSAAECGRDHCANGRCVAGRPCPCNVGRLDCVACNDRTVSLASHKHKHKTPFSDACECLNPFCACCNEPGPPSPEESVWINVTGYPGVQVLGVIVDGLIRPAGPHLQMRRAPKVEKPPPHYFPGPVPYVPAFVPSCASGRCPR